MLPRQDRRVRSTSDGEAVELLVKLLVVAMVMWMCWVLLQPRCAFIVKIVGGQVHTSRGVVTPAFLEQVREMSSRHGVQSGTVRGVIRGSRISLGFGGGIPTGGQQQLRNWWARSGWSARPPERGGPPRRA
jgi:hypothetical protein